MSSPYVGEIRIFAGNFAPQGWAFCDGSMLSIAVYDVLFQLIGTTYGGDGQSIYALPDLRGRVPVHIGQGPGLPIVNIGEIAGTETAPLLASQIPTHSHPFSAVTGGVRETSPANNRFAAGGPELYASGNGPAAGVLTALQPAGAGVAHDNMAPYLTVSFIICLFGIFPSQ